MTKSLAYFLWTWRLPDDLLDEWANYYYAYSYLRPYNEPSQHEWFPAIIWG